MKPCHGSLNKSSNKSNVSNLKMMTVRRHPSFLISGDLLRTITLL